MEAEAKNCFLAASLRDILLLPPPQNLVFQLSFSGTLAMDLGGRGEREFNLAFFLLLLSLCKKASLYQTKNRYATKSER